MSNNQKKMVIFCHKCQYCQDLNLPIEIDQMVKCIAAMKTLHQHNHQCFEELIARPSAELIVALTES